MLLSCWLSWPFSRNNAVGCPRRNLASRPRRARLELEPLEGRALLASYTAASVSALIADIQAANTAGGANTITLTAPTTSPYELTATNNTSTAAGPNGLPVIAANDNLTIVGNGDTIERHSLAAFRLFDVAPEASLTLQNLSLERGSATGQGVGFCAGGAIDNTGALTLSGVIVSGNDAGGNGDALGGGIWSNGSLVLENGTSLQDNIAQGRLAGGGGNNEGLPGAPVEIYPALGGAVYIAGGTANITNITLTGNRAYGGGDEVAIAFGGALYVAAGQINLTNTTVTNNQEIGSRAGGGGGIYIAGGTVTLASDTLESNATTAFGGGIDIAGGTVTLTNDSVESNSTITTCGGVYIATGAKVTLDPFTVANTINNADTEEETLNGPTANIDGTYMLS
jgi:hypothetical protein